MEVGCWSGGSKFIIDFRTSAVSEGAGSGRESTGVGPGVVPVPALFLPDPAHSEPADVMKSVMYFDPPLHILTSIRLHIWPSPYLTYSAISIRRSQSSQLALAIGCSQFGI